MLNIAKTAQEVGCICYVAYANSRTNKRKIVDNSLLIGTVFERNLHLQLAYYTGFNGCFSIKGTRNFLRQVDVMKPDIIHLHNLHNCYINLKMLFDYIKEKNIPVVWTLHDCWAFTGQCVHFTMAGCNKWQTGCYNCPQYKRYPASKFDLTRIMYKYKKEWFTGVNNLTIVTPSRWLSNTVSNSFLGCYPVEVINNGIDLNIFKPTQSNFRERYNLQGKTILLGVASGWSKAKGLDIFINLSKKIGIKYKIVLVGLTLKQLKDLPYNILGLSKINSVKELCEIYTAADYFINPSLEETMGLVTVEALACGTPVIVSNSTAVPEVVNENCGRVVLDYSADRFLEVIENLNESFLAEDCINQARKYEKSIKYKEYINLYRKIIK